MLGFILDPGVTFNTRRFRKPFISEFMSIRLRMLVAPPKLSNETQYTALIHLASAGT
jgi:hypothetical protein